MATLLNNDGKIIAIDFDGTIVEHKYPAIGKEMLFAFATIKELQKKGHRLILWTFRRTTTGRSSRILPQERSGILCCE